MIRERAPACERNRDPILSVLRETFADVRRLLEIGSGTGEHAVYFSRAMPHIEWQPSEMPGREASIRAWMAHERLPNLLAPVPLDVSATDWGVEKVDGVFTANTLHIMSWQCVLAFFSGVGRVLAPGGVVTVYGPFNYDGRFTSASNEHFDASLRGRNADSGIRDFEAVNRAAATLAGLALTRDVSMPANNRCLAWRRV